MSGASTPQPENRSASVATTAKGNDGAHMKLLEVVLSAAPVRDMSSAERELRSQEWLARRRRLCKKRMYSAVPQALDVTHLAAPMPTPSRVVNRWDHYCRLYGSRDALCEELGDPDADALVYSLRRTAQRSSPLWHAALVDRDPVVLSNAPALWYPVLTTTMCEGFSLPMHAAYTATHSNILMPPRTAAGKALRAQMHHSDLLGSFHQELLEKVELEVAPVYRADMALALLFLVVEAFAGEVLPPVYMVHVAMQSMVEALGEQGTLPLDQLVPSSAFQSAVFLYLERWVETALVAEWRDMLGCLLGVITPALPVALRLVVDTVLPTAADVLKPTEALWQWALPVSFTLDRGGPGGKNARASAQGWWVAFPAATARALENTMPNEVADTPSQSVVEANHFEEVVHWSVPASLMMLDSAAEAVVVGTVVRHESLPLRIRRLSRHRDIVLACPEVEKGVPSTPTKEPVDWDHNSTALAPSGENVTVPPYATVAEHHWSRRLGLSPLPEEDAALQSVFAALVSRGAGAPDRDVHLADYGPAYAPYLRGVSPHATKHAAMDPPDGPCLWDPSPRTEPRHVVSHVVCCADVGTTQRGTVGKLPPSLRAALKDLRASSLWKPRSDQQDIILHYYDGYCSAKVAVSLMTFLKLLSDANANALDALVLFGHLSNAQSQIIPKSSTAVALADQEISSSGAEALNIQLLPLTAEHELLQRIPSRLRRGATHVSDQKRDDLSAASDDEESEAPHTPTSFTCDVFTTVTDTRLDHLMRPLLITTGGAGVVRHLIQTIKRDVAMQQQLLQSRAATSMSNDDPLSISTSAFGYAPDLVANKRHIRVIIEAAPLGDAWAQPIDHRHSVSALDQLPPPSGEASPTAVSSWKPPQFSSQGALALELKRLNPNARVHMPLGGLRSLPQKVPTEVQRGKPPGSIYFPEAQVNLAVFHDRVRRNRRFLFNAVKSTSPPLSARASPSGSNPGSPTSSAFSAGVDMRAALAQLRDGGVVPITNMSLTNVFRVPDGPSPMGLGTLIHGAQGGSALDAFAAPPHKSQRSGRALEPTGGSKRQGKKLVPMAESSALQANLRRSMRRSHSPTDSTDASAVVEAPPKLQRRASYLETSVSGQLQRNATPPEAGDETENWRTRSKELRSGGETPWTALPPLRAMDASLRILAPEAARRRQNQLPAGTMLPVLKPQKRFEKLRKKAQSAPPFF